MLNFDGGSMNSRKLQSQDSAWGWVLFALFLLVGLAVPIGMIYVVVHFLAKWW